MKRIFYIVMIVIALISLAGCTGRDVNSQVRLSGGESFF